MKQFPLKSTLTAAFALAIIFTFSCSGGGDPDGGTIYGADVPYQGETYKTVKIGSQTWMARNLNYDPGTGNSSCYDNSSANCDKYGRLYDWATAMGIDARYNEEEWGGSDVKHQGICPKGWHLPSDAEWTTLTDFVGGASTAGTKLKATTGWKDGGNGQDTYGFSALPGGQGRSGGGFYDVGDFGFWWSASEYDSEDAYVRGMNGGERAYYSDGSKDILFSVRCVQD